MAQLVASASSVVLGGVAEVVGSNLAGGKIFTASIGSVDSLYPVVYIYIYKVMLQASTHMCFSETIAQNQVWRYNISKRSYVSSLAENYKHRTLQPP